MSRGLGDVYKRQVYGRSLRKAAVVFAVAPSLGAEARARFGLEAERVVVAPNAVSRTFVLSEGTERDGALVVSRDEPRKARGAAELAAREAGLELTIVDDERDDPRLAAHYARARWLLAPSLHEGYGMTVAEALACGTPVVATDHAAHRDIERLGARGIVFVPPPRRAGDDWQWPEAVAALRGALPADIAPPPTTWDETAAIVADAIGR